MIWINVLVKRDSALSHFGMELRMSDGDPPAEESGSESPDPDDDRTHFADLPDGSGCIEIWEHLSEQRTRADSKTRVNE